MLAALAGTTGAMSASQVADVAGPAAPLRTVQHALADLVAEGLVIRQEIGRTSSYRLNRSHVAAGAVEMLADLRGELVRRATTLLEEWTIPPRRAVLFGSASRADGDSSSDIDIYLERPATVDAEDDIWSDLRNDLVDAVQRWTGNDVEVLEYGEDEIDERDWSTEAVLAAIKRDGVLLFGDPMPRRVKVTRRRSRA